MAYTVQVKGLRELTRSLKAADTGLAAAMKGELKEVGEPVRADAQSRAHWTAVGPYKVIVYARGDVRVRQSKNKVTGLRGDFGALQMREALVPALEAHEGEIIDRFGDVVDRVNAAAGLL